MLNVDVRGREMWLRRRQYERTGRRSHLARWKRAEDRWWVAFVDCVQAGARALGLRARVSHHD